MRYCFLFVLCCSTFWSFGQYYVFGGYNYGAVTMKGANAIMTQFNQRENHQLPMMQNNFHGYRVGAGRYSKFTIVELDFGNINSVSRSVNPNQLKENVEVIANYMSASIRLGLKPFPKHFFTFGAAMHLGGQRLRYSFGGDYELPVEEYVIAPEVYIDYAIRLKFLLKKSQRADYFYLLRIRPYYQFHTKIPIGNFESEFNGTPNVNKTDIEDNLSHFGIQVSLAIPFITAFDREYLFGPSPKKKRKKKQKRNSKEPRKGVL